ncbi:restriction endonuclease subunit S [Epilithonimonas zeae]|uniref:restriction endonuclease subunit S n=1 Tax=Epilithonimonas zeae TaxID=1416779 RepID=UPI00200F6327|nr:restriction endonuclease subunit S [Epilithonimonas zeae]UQB69936.1 restriction endonuclease subunit S [Epilithonimonas zeae]
MREGWIDYKLGEVVEIKYGKDHKKLRDGNYPLYGSGGVMRYVDSYLYDKESVLIPRKGTLSNLFYLNEPFSTVDTMFWTKIDKSITEPRFLYYLLKTYDLASLDEGAAIPSLTTKALNVVNISLPQLETQRKIASILSGYDDLIENNLKRIKILEEMTQQTYEEWFVRMRFPGYETAVFGDNGLPEGWEKVKLGDEFIIKNGKSFKGLNTGNPYENKIYGSNGIIGYSNLSNTTNSVIIGRVGAYCGSINYCSEDYWATDNTIFVEEKFNNISIELAYFILKQLNLRTYAGGAAQPLLTQNTINQLEIIKPSKELIIKFSEKCKNINKQIINLTNQNQRLREARDILLPRLMMGIIDVESLETKQNEAKIIPLAQPKKETSKEFKEAVLIACLVERFGSEKYPLGRKRYTKLSYLFHRYSDNKIQDYLRKAAGPYNPKTKYGGPEKIALQNKYIQNWKGDKGTTGFVTAEKIEDAKKYFSNYWQVADLDWLTTEFKFKSNDELELLATVDNSLVELSKKNLEFTTVNVLDIIESEKEWEAKLERTIFSNANVEGAIGFLRGVLEYNS